MSEEQALLRPGAEHIEPEASSAVILSFEPNSPGNPRNWPDAFKWRIVLMLACMAFAVTFTCISIVPIANQIVADLDNGQPSSVGSALLVTIWEFGEAAGPLLIAPLSEVFGRYPVMNVANIIFIAATVSAALSQSTPLFIACRALTGLAVAVNVLNPAIIGDIFAPDQRGSAMSLIMCAPLIGGAIGPAVSGLIAERVGWRAVVLIGAALAVACEVVFLTCFRETYKLTILRRRAQKLGKGSAKRGPGFKMVLDSVSRPFAVLFGSGVLSALSLFGSVSFSYFYVLSVSLPSILQDIYHFTPGETGSAFVALTNSLIGIGSFVAIAICHTTIDKISMKLRGSPNNPNLPEYRLPLAIAAGLAMPFVMVAYGFIAQYRLPVWILLTAAALLDGTTLLILIPLSSYVVDAGGVYSASAMTGLIVTRCLMGTFLPLTTGPLVEALGYGWGISIFGAFSLLLAPIPMLIMRYGEKWRQRSEYTRESENE
ncbi:MFS multidrug transporter-like protein [Ilyonectria robusta]|uniref:MFS multidrug transporter-like protein n=1 Tax=Ilyonectria robusta TaxID=1079257 RepID=UPI001E8E1733|nr:MFS multidrug transporter-like protein [Ilyonectria robusta]KAH8672216.1 MFS multidrug transporter-like protein [Ilyonectria robusta]